MEREQGLRLGREAFAGEAPVLLDGTKLGARLPAVRSTPYEEGLAITIGWLRAHPNVRMYF